MHNPLKGEKKQPPIRKNIPYYKYTYLYIYFYLFLSFFGGAAVVSFPHGGTIHTVPKQPLMLFLSFCFEIHRQYLPTGVVYIS